MVSFFFFLGWTTVLSFKPHENCASLSVCWNAELVPGGHNLLRHLHTQSLWCAGMSACWEGPAALLSCYVSFFFFFPSFRVLQCWICLVWLLSRQAEKISLQTLKGLGSSRPRSPEMSLSKPLNANRLQGCCWESDLTSDLTGNYERSLVSDYFKLDKFNCVIIPLKIWAGREKSLPLHLLSLLRTEYSRLVCPK